MKDTKFIRDGRKITEHALDNDGNVEFVSTSYKSINEAKRKSREFQLSQDGALGRGSLQVSK